MQKWQRIGEPELAYDGWRSVYRKKFIMPNGREMVAETVYSPDYVSAAAIALTPDGRVIISEQFRCGPEKICWELPGGVVDVGELPDVAIVRELAEETGYTAGSVEYLGSSHRDCWTNGTWHYYLMRDCVPTGEGQQLDEFEMIDVRLISVSELLAAARAGKVTDVLAILLAYERLREMEGRACEKPCVD